MNEQIFDLWLDQKKIPNTQVDETTLRFFLRYLDKHSLRLSGVDSQNFHFTNDAQQLKFSFVEIKERVGDMKNGIPFPWERYTDV